MAALDELPSPTQHADRDATLELRVLSGAHSEARCAVHDGATVGSDMGCDIVLEDSDAPQYHIHLNEEKRQWSLSASSEPADETPHHALNEPVLLGEVAITIAPEAMPWPVMPSPDTEAAFAAAGNQALVASLDADEPLPDERPAQPAAEATGKAVHIPSKPVVPPLRKRDAWPVVLGVVAVLLAILVAIIMAYLPGTDGAVQRTADTRSEAGQQSLSQINATLERLGLASRLHVSISGDGVVTVSGWVQNDQEERQVAAALSQIWPMPALRLSIEAQALRRAQDALKKFPINYAVRYDGNGRLHVAGISPDTQTRAAALRALAEQVPGMTILGNDIVLGRDVEHALLARLKAANLSVASLKWLPDGLEVDISNVDASDQSRMQAILENFNTTYLDILRWTRPRVAAPKPDNSIPFQIRSVVGGPQPFVVLSDGSRLMTGGTYQGYRLVEISDTRLVFEGSHRAIVPR